MHVEFHYRSYRATINVKSNSQSSISLPYLFAVVVHILILHIEMWMITFSVRTSRITNQKSERRFLITRDAIGYDAVCANNNETGVCAALEHKHVNIRCAFDCVKCEGNYVEFQRILMQSMTIKMISICQRANLNLFVQNTISIQRAVQSSTSLYLIIFHFNFICWKFLFKMLPWLAAAVVH